MQENLNVEINSDLLSHHYLKLKNCFLSTSSNASQGVKIDGKIYSHIVNPKDGKVNNNFDAVLVKSSKGYLGDALSTHLVNCTVDEIKEVEAKYSVQVVAIKNKTIIYQNENIEVLSK